MREYPSVRLDYGWEHVCMSGQRVNNPLRTDIVWITTPHEVSRWRVSYWPYAGADVGAGRTGQKEADEGAAHQQGLCLLRQRSRRLVNTKSPIYKFIHIKIEVVVFSADLKLINKKVRWAEEWSLVSWPEKTRCSHFFSSKFAELIL